MRVAIFSAVGLIAPTVLFVGPTAASPSAADVTAGSQTSSTYTVKSGDSVGLIAQRLKVKLDDLLSANKLLPASVIHPGQVLVVPGAPAAASASAPGTYVIVVGDSLFRIATSVGVSLTSLMTTNTLTTTSLIKPGQTLIIPAGGHPPVAKTNSGPGTTPTTTPTTTPAAAAPAATTPATTLPAGSTTYTIVSGDYLASIASRSGVTLKALLAANNLLVTSLILPGTVLIVPPATLPSPAVTTPTTAPAVTPPSTPDTAATTAPAAAASSASQTQIATVLTFLRAQVGKAYAFNTAGPDTFDCSGLVTAAYQLVGIDLPHQSLLQSRKGTAVDWLTEPLLPGDLVFQISSATPTVIGHVGIVVDATHWIQAARPGVPISIGNIPSSAKIQAVRRIIQP